MNILTYGLTVIEDIIQPLLADEKELAESDGPTAAKNPFHGLNNP